MPTRHTLVRLAIALAIASLPLSTYAAELIRDFSVDATIAPDATVMLTETISYDFGTDERHCIFRDIPTRHPEPASAWYRNRYIDIAVASVTRDGAPEPFAIERDDEDGIRVRIGDPNATISGERVYAIEYELKGALSYPRGERPELYWNVTGNGWEVPILATRATIHDPGQILSDTNACHRGFPGSAGSCIVVATTSGAIFTAANLSPGEGMTIAAAIDTGKVATVRLERANAGLLFILFGVPLIAGLVLLGIYRIYRYKTRYRIDTPIIAQYEPYPGILPMYTGVLIDGRLDARDITAGIVYLAEQGYLKITKTERKAFFLFEVDDYEITLMRTIEEDIPEYGKRILDLIFSVREKGTTVRLSDLATDVSQKLKNSRTLESLRVSFEKRLVREGFYEKIYSFKEIKLSPGVTKSTWFGYSTYLFFPLVILSLFFEVFTIIFGVIFVALFCLIVLGAIASSFLRRRTQKGCEALNHLRGYKLYLSVAEKDRLTFHNAPEKSPEEFLIHLPYAIAFGVEDKWAEVFKDISIPAPEWYGGTPGSFNASTFGASMGAFSSALSTSSGSSASSGGGSSGGGGGGGGGGSW